MQTGVCQSDPGNLLVDMTEVRRHRFQKLASNWRILEQVPDLNLCSQRAATRLGQDDITQIDADFHSMRLIRLARSNSQAADFGD